MLGTECSTVFTHLVSKPDEDGDGVPDDVDQCRGTAPGAKVDVNGCSLDPNDSDLDGVPNEFDACPNTPFGAPINFNGCPLDLLDTDLDGVPDDFDQCPDTEPFFPVDIKGCPLDFNDDDGDGVPNSFDRCPETPLGTPTDFEGCPLDLGDDDGDGVINSFDRCPDTPAGKLVDFDGCPLDTRDDDGDGVINGLDFCPDTPPGDNVNEFGCTVLPDEDNDGIPDEFDLCLGTPPGTPVNFDGCPFDFGDDDGDGVPNSFDRCPDSPAGVPVDFEGCPLDMGDDDGDGVINGLDFCPDTPPGDRVDEFGCTVLPDEDGDGVPDIFDRCPGTPPGSITDLEGCALIFDADEDGVTDDVDQCPGTPPGTAVDALGCPQIDEDEDGDAVPDSVDQCPGTALGESVNPVGCPAEFFVEILGQLEIAGISNAQVKIKASDLVLSQTLSAGSALKAVANSSFVVIEEQAEHVGVLLSRPDTRGAVQVPVFFETEFGETSNVFEVTIDVRPLNTKSSLLIHDHATLDAFDFSLVDLFDKLAAESDSGQTGVELFRQFWDAQLTTSVMGSTINCVPINGFPITCDREEAKVAELNAGDLLLEMQSYRVLAAVNRMELRNDWQDCGEHRMVFGRTNFNGRNFLIFEARLPNPTPGQASGCANIVDFWTALSDLDPQTQANERAAMLRAFYVDGVVTGIPVFSVEHFAEGAGQVRTNQFIRPLWLLREYKLARVCDPVCRITGNPVSVKENPFGPLCNPLLPGSDSEFSAIAEEFQTLFPQSLATLTTQNFGELKIDMPDRFNNGQSHADFPEAFENDFVGHFGGNLGSDFGIKLDEQLQSVIDARGDPLSVDQLLSRATAMSCGGCHLPDNFRLTEPNSIGALRLPNGEIIDSWPRSLGFVHVDEGRNVSEAIERVFLPVRLQAFADAISEINAQ